MSLQRRGFLAGAASAILAAPALSFAQGQAYPAKGVRVVTQGAAGSGPDVIARIVTDQLSRMWNQQVVILNQPGAGGVPAARMAAQAEPDGYTLYFAAISSFIVMPEMFPNLPFDLDRDFVRIGMVIEQPMLFAVSPSLGVSTLPELIALSKREPGKIMYAANARGSFPHVTTERFRKETGADFNYIPYPGAPQGLQDLVGGRINMIVESAGALGGAIQNGNVKVLASASTRRLPNFPDVATVTETVPGFSAMGWFALLAPAGTPAAIVQQVNKDLRTVLDMADVQQKFQVLGTFSRPSTPTEATDYIREQQKVWRPIVRSLALTPPQ